MIKDSKKSRRFSKSFILGALILYVSFGLVALGYYYQYYYGFPILETAAESESAEDTQEVSEAEKNTIPGKSAHEKYDIEEGNAGAARDLDIE